MKITAFNQNREATPEELDKIKRGECISPGCCCCPDMSRCKDCGYTKHDKDFWLDHSICEKRK